MALTHNHSWVDPQRRTDAFLAAAVGKGAWAAVRGVASTAGRQHEAESKSKQSAAATQGSNVVEGDIARAPPPATGAWTPYEPSAPFTAEGMYHALPPQLAGAADPLADPIDEVEAGDGAGAPARDGPGSREAGAGAGPASSASNSRPWAGTTGAPTQRRAQGNGEGWAVALQVRCRTTCCCYAERAHEQWPCGEAGASTLLVQFSQTSWAFMNGRGVRA